MSDGKYCCVCGRNIQDFEGSIEMNYGGDLGSATVCLECGCPSDHEAGTMEVEDEEAAAYNASRGTDGDMIPLSLYKAMVHLRGIDALNFHLGWHYKSESVESESKGGGA